MEIIYIKNALNFDLKKNYCVTSSNSTIYDMTFKYPFPIPAMPSNHADYIAIEVLAVFQVLRIL